MLNSFDTEIAMDVGINAAIIYKNIQYWCEKNRTNGQNEHDGYFWTYNSISAFCEQFPYLSEKQIRKALVDLEEAGYIKSANYNKVAYDRTKWYADCHVQKVSMHTDKREVCICPTGQMELPSEANGIATEGKPIPDIKPNNNTNDLSIKKESKPKKDSQKFIPPSIEEVSAYCIERGNKVNPQRFIDHYTSNGWMVGKNKMKDWQAAVRTWERNALDQKPAPQVQKKFVNPFEELEKELGYDTEGIDPALEAIIS